MANELWALLIPGPDDVWAMPNKESAESAMAEHNKCVDGADWPLPELRDQCRASVIIWPHSAESHEECLAVDEPAGLEE
jgi:hypothetical protein